MFYQRVVRPSSERADQRWTRLNLVERPSTLLSPQLPLPRRRHSYPAPSHDNSYKTLPDRWTAERIPEESQPARGLAVQPGGCTEVIRSTIKELNHTLA